MTSALPSTVAAPRDRLPDLLAGWRPGDFLMEREGAGLVAAAGGRVIPVPAGPELAARAAALAEAALVAAGPGAAPVVGALPFRGDGAAQLTLPRVATMTAPRRASWDGTRTAGVPPPAATAPQPRPAPAPTPVRWRAEPSAAHFAALVTEAIRRIRAGQLEKVVLTRSLVAANPGLDLGVVLGELRRRDPGCHLFAAAAPGGVILVGATPETLLRRRGDSVVSVPHAGTAPRSADPAADRGAGEALLRSAKDRHEHRVVVEAVADALSPHCESLSVDPVPHLTSTATVWHLASTVSGRLRSPAPGALALAAALHPTPAVCGSPVAIAEALIGELEGSSRGLYAGLVGWMDSRGDGEWAVSLRCAQVTAAELRLHGGVGIVAESDPESELAETEPKLRTLLDALRAAGLAEAG
jgi:isochorismate synthase